MDLTEKQPNEKLVVMTKQPFYQPRCFICKEPIKEGQECYQVKGKQKFIKRRHTTCTRKSPGKTKQNYVPTQQIGQAANGRVIRDPRGL